jgi:hypothetical protein
MEGNRLVSETDKFFTKIGVRGEVGWAEEMDIYVMTLNN